jgi:hypothetical protein
MLRPAFGVASLVTALVCAGCGGSPSGALVESTAVESTPAALTAPSPKTASPRRGVIHASIEDTMESPEFSMDLPSYVKFGQYTLVVDDRSSCAFHMWGPGVDVITTRHGINRFEIELQPYSTYTAACNWAEIGRHPPHSEGLRTDNLPWATTLEVTR